MKTPEDNYTSSPSTTTSASTAWRRTCSTRASRPGRSTDLENWLLLAASYQQINQDFKAIEVAEGGRGAVPEERRARVQDRPGLPAAWTTERGLHHAQIGVDKGGLAKPSRPSMFIAYVAYELQASSTRPSSPSTRRSTLQSGKPDHQVLGLRNAIDEAIKERKRKGRHQKAADANKLNEDQQFAHMKKSKIYFIAPIARARSRSARTTGTSSRSMMRTSAEQVAADKEKKLEKLKAEAATARRRSTTP